MEYTIKSSASRWAIFWTLVAIGLGLISGLFMDSNTNAPNEVKGVASAIVSLGVCILIATRTIKGYHVADVLAGRQAVKDREFAEKVAQTAVAFTNEAHEAAAKATQALQTEQALTERLSNEVELLRKGERERIAKIEKAGAEIEKAMSLIEKGQADYEKVKADYEKVIADNQKLQADNQKLQAEIEKAKADNQKLRKSFEATLLDNEPIINLGNQYIRYRLNKSKNASSALTEEERAEAKMAFEAAKVALDEFISNYKTQ